MYGEWQSVVRGDLEAIGLHRMREVAHPRVSQLSVLITMVGPGAIGLAEPMFGLEFRKRVHGVALEMQDQSAAVLKALTVAERAVAVVPADGRQTKPSPTRWGRASVP